MNTRGSRRRACASGLDAATIRRYCACVDTLDKAGAYAIQEQGEMLVAAIEEGERENVVGLPVGDLLAHLRALEDADAPPPRA